MEPWGYIVLVGAAAIVYALMLPARQQEKSGVQQSLKDTEAALELYMSDLEREQEKMIELVASLKQQNQQGKNALLEEIGALKEQVSELRNLSGQLESRLAASEREVQELGTAQARAEAARQAAAPAEAMHEQSKPKPVSSIKLRYPRLFELYEEGKSIDAIAKMAGLQRGEVQLILQLAKQEESV
ncbi:hypothetical protein [Paenibacillus tengchongensis]|uniref:hypothetical protein n=1 Tax=Paenibacillus tengchongensis TaxID=2608684 RepID=UPI00124D035F|nr:hypothetical protein [Paenibacillus tengchongensis]